MTEWLNWTEYYNDAHVHCVKRKWSDITIVIAFRKFLVQFWHLLKQEDLTMQVWIYKDIVGIGRIQDMVLKGNRIVVQSLKHIQLKDMSLDLQKSCRDR